MHVCVIGVPMDLGQDRRGVDIGPSAIRYAGLNDQLTRLGHTIRDAGNIVIPQPESQEIGNPRLKYLKEIVAASQELAGVVSTALQKNEFPLTLGGDHSIALGSITGVTRVYPKTGVIWIDAHSDFNTDETTHSGNIHGMILGALAGVGNTHLVNLDNRGRKLDPNQIVIIGARNLDLQEQQLLHQQHIHVFTMSDIDKRGMAAIMHEAVQIAGQGTDSIHLSLDMDALDPQEAPGVGTPVRGGLSYREAHLAMEIVADSPLLHSMDVVEVNALLDHNNITARLAVELMVSALGKKIW